MKKTNIILLGLLSLSLFTFCGNRQKTEKNRKKEIDVVAKKRPVFDADSAYSYIQKQVNFGARVPNSQAHKLCLEYLNKKLEYLGAEVTVQKGRGTLYDGKSVEINNIIGSFNLSAENRILLAAHWDSRPFADQDKDQSKHHTPILGANDGASGVGVLLEVARNINNAPKDLGIDIIFFDVEDYGTPYFHKGSYNSNSWCIGSRYWAKNPHIKNYRAKFGILLDMVGGRNAKFYQEYYSLLYAGDIVKKVWINAIESGFDGYFIRETGGEIMDDHIAINEYIKIPTIDIIDYQPNSQNGFNQHWHTTKDDMDNIDHNSLYVVGQTLINIIFE